jgi:DNA-binding NarL/FixJ family response regulator
MIRVLVADDEALVRNGICAILESAGDIAVTAQADNGRTAVSQALAYRPDVVLIDIKMPTADGLGAVEELRRQAPAVRVVVLTSFGTRPNAVRALQSGVAGFLLKNAPPEDLIRAVRAAHRGEAFLSPAVTRMALDLIEPADAGRRQEAAARLTALAPRESDVLRLLAGGLSNAEIGQRLSLSEPTIKAYVSRILAKLGCANRVQAALLARDADPTWPGDRAGGDRRH